MHIILGLVLNFFWYLQCFLSDIFFTFDHFLSHRVSPQQTFTRTTHFRISHHNKLPFRFTSTCASSTPWRWWTPPWVLQVLLSSWSSWHDPPCWPGKALRLGPGRQWGDVLEFAPPTQYSYPHGQCRSVGVIIAMIRIIWELCSAHQSGVLFP